MNPEETTVTLRLPVTAVNALLGYAAQQPYREVSELIAEVLRQAQGQLTPATTESPQ